MMHFLYTGILLLSFLSAMVSGTGEALAASILEGARAGIQLAITLAGPLLFFSGLGTLMDRVGLTSLLARCFSPLLSGLFPKMKEDPVLAGHLSANFCANLLGLGNAATPRGIQAACRLKEGSTATDQLCRLIVLNTASIQLIPSSVAAIRSGLGCAAPFDILPAVWITSFCSAGLGLLSAAALGKVWKL